MSELVGSPSACNENNLELGDKLKLAIEVIESMNERNREIRNEIETGKRKKRALEENAIVDN